MATAKNYSPQPKFTDEEKKALEAEAKSKDWSVKKLTENIIRDHLKGVKKKR